MTRLDAFKLVMMLGAAFPQRELGEPTIELYVDFLVDLEHDAAARAVQELIATRTWLPTIGEIRAAVATQSGPPVVELAWEEVCREIVVTGSYQRPKFSHPLIARAVATIGWRALCHSTTPGLERKSFMDIYRTLRERELTAAATATVGALSIAAADRAQVESADTARRTSAGAAPSGSTSLARRGGPGAPSPTTATVRRPA